MNGPSRLSDEEWERHVAFVVQRLDELRRNNVDSRTVCGHLDRGWVRWSAERRVQHRHLLRDLWTDESAGVPREAKGFLLGGNDSGARLEFLCDPHVGVDPDQYLVIDPLWIKCVMATRSMVPHIDGLAPIQQEATELVHEEAWQLAERLAQRAYSDKCNVLWVITGDSKTSDAAQARDFALEPGQDEETVRSIIKRYEHNEMDFRSLREALVSRWRGRPEKDLEPASWAEVYRRSELIPDDDDLIWISVAEDRGALTVEQAEYIFTAIEFASDDQNNATGLAEGNDHTTTQMPCEEEVVDRWLYFADANQALIRVLIANDRYGERYWGRNAGWLPSGPGSVSWAYHAGFYPHYQRVNEADIASIQEHIDHQSGGAFRDRWRFWGDQGYRWSLSDASQRVAKLELAISDPTMYWSWQEYRSDCEELERLRSFIGQLT